MIVHPLAVPCSLALLLSLHGLRKKSLSPGGAITAFIVGFAIMASAVHAFGIGLIAFYFIGSRATKYGKKTKLQLEEGYHVEGYRSGWQVLCNSISALIAASFWDVCFVPGSIHGLLAKSGGLGVPTSFPMYEANLWCPTDRSLGGGGRSRLLFFIVLGQYACCLGDTLASELGVLSKSPPRMITNFKPVPPGTNGAVSLGGTIASIIGGVLVGLAMGASLVAENTVCNRNDLMECMAWGGIAGGVGSMVDSVMGAMLQETLYDGDKKRVAQRKGKGVAEIGGWNILTNNQVNLLSSTICALLIGWVTSR